MTFNDTICVTTDVDETAGVIRLLYLGFLSVKEIKKTLFGFVCLLLNGKEKTFINVHKQILH